MSALVCMRQDHIGLANDSGQTRDQLPNLKTYFLVRIAEVETLIGTEASELERGVPFTTAGFGVLFASREPDLMSKARIPRHTTGGVNDGRLLPLVFGKTRQIVPRANNLVIRMRHHHDKSTGHIRALDAIRMAARNL